MLFGADYYPEHWDKSEWEEHAKLMEACHFNVVRVAEFSWCKLEPREGEYDFAWLDEAIEILARHGVKVILGTPTAAPPKWLDNQYDICMRDKYGRKRDFGSRRQACANHPKYIERSKVIVEKMAEHYGNNPNVVGWQIDNEFGCHGSVKCYCKYCKAQFSNWTRDKYSTIENLNKQYGTIFWSQEYADFNDLILPAYTSCEPDYGKIWTHNPSLDLDFYRFSSDSWVDYQQIQIDIIRKYSKAPITHNMMGHFTGIDYYKLGKALDVVAWDNYVQDQWGNSTPERVAMAHELMHGIKNQKFWVMEEQVGPCGWDRFGKTPRPGQIRLWTYQAIAHGCEGLLYFRFKSAPFGMEQYWLGVIDHDGVPRRRYEEVKQIGKELEQLSHLFVGSKQKAEALMVISYEVDWSHQIKQHVNGFEYKGLLQQYYTANHHLGIAMTCGSEEMIDLQYKVIYMPAYVMVSEEVKAKLEAYVAAGGTLVLTYRSGIKDLNNNIIRDTLPGKLRQLAGICVDEYDTTPTVVALDHDFGNSKMWRDVIKLETAEAKVLYEGEYYKGSPAITVNSYGKGKVWYIASDLEDAAVEKLIHMISKEAGLNLITHSEGTEIVKRQVEGREYLVLLNHTGEEKEMGMTGISLISGKPFNGKLAEYGVEVLEV